MSRPGTLAADLIDWPDRIAILQRVCDENSVRRRTLGFWYVAAHPSDDDGWTDFRAHLTVLEHRAMVLLRYRDGCWEVTPTRPGRRLLARARHEAKAAAATTPVPGSRRRQTSMAAGR